MCNLVLRAEIQRVSGSRSRKTKRASSKGKNYIFFEELKGWRPSLGLESLSRNSQQKCITC
jgi:hypothetical protein